MKIEKIYEASSRSKLTISKERATMRFQKGATDEEKSRIEKFLSTVITTASPCDSTISGHMAKHAPSDTLYIVLKNRSGTYSERFFEKESK